MSEEKEKTIARARELARRADLLGELRMRMKRSFDSASDARAFLEVTTGKSTTDACSNSDLEALLAELKMRDAAAHAEPEFRLEDADAVIRGETVEIITVPSENAIVAHFERFQRLKSVVLKDEDYLYLDEHGKPCSKDGSAAAYIRKSGWRKIALIFGICIECKGFRSITGTDQDGDWHGVGVLVKAITRNGRFVEAEGVCTTRNKFFCSRYNEATHKREWVDTDEKNLICTAQTVAINRAIADLVGCGEMSAEETLE